VTTSAAREISCPEYPIPMPSSAAFSLITNCSPPHCMVSFFVDTGVSVTAVGQPLACSITWAGAGSGWLVVRFVAGSGR
jgi:hypothetical protein